jgi:hypothetical protein
MLAAAFAVGEYFQLAFGTVDQLLLAAVRPGAGLLILLRLPFRGHAVFVALHIGWAQLLLARSEIASLAALTEEDPLVRAADRYATIRKFARRSSRCSSSRRPKATTRSRRDHTAAKSLSGVISARSIPREERAEDLVGACRFLVSEAASFIAGQIIVEDGASTFH